MTTLTSVLFHTLMFETLTKVQRLINIQSLLISKAETLKIEISNPSPSGDEYFTDSDNLAEIEKRAKTYKESKGKDKITLRSAEEITNFINNL